MLNRFGKVILILVFIVTAACSQEQEKAGPGSLSQEQVAATEAALENMALVGVEKQLVDTLLVLWRDRSNLTSVNQAAVMLGVDLTDSMRIELFDKFNANLDLCERLKRYRPCTITLTNKEKLLAQYLVNYEKRSSEFPPIDLVASDLGVSVDEIQEELKFLAQIEFFFDLDGPSEYNVLGFSYGSKMSEFIYDTGMRYHTFYVEDKAPFNVCCAKEAFFKILRDFSDKNVRYETFDPLKLEQVQVIFKNSQIVSISPDTAVFLEGGYCGANNLFVSEEAASIWAESVPFVRDSKITSIPDIVAKVKVQLEAISEQ